MRANSHLIAIIIYGLLPQQHNTWLLLLGYRRQQLGNRQWLHLQAGTQAGRPPSKCAGRRGSCPQLAQQVVCSILCS